MKTPTLSVAALIAASALSATGALVFNVFPLFLGATSAQFGFDDQQLGLLGSAYLGGFSLVALTAVYWITRISWKIAGVASVIVICLSVLGLSTVQGPTLINAMVALLGAGSCVIFSISLRVLSHARDIDRAYGIKLCAEMILAGVVMFVMSSYILGEFGFTGFIGSIAVIYAVSGFALIWLPQAAELETAENQASTKQLFTRGSLPAWMASVALFMQFGVMSALWGFMERIGTAAGVTAATVGDVLTLALVAGLGGAFLAALLGDRFGQVKPLLACFTVIFAAVVLLTTGDGAVVYALCACLISAALQFVIAYQMGLITAVDRHEVFTTLIPFILASGGAVGPGVAGLILDGTGFTPIYVLAGVVTIICFLITISSVKLVPLAEPQPAGGI